MLIPPYLVFSRSGVEVIREAAKMPSSFRLRERRRHGLLWGVGNGLMMGLCIGVVGNVAAEGNMSEWTSPGTLMAVASMVFAFGQVIQARKEDQRRIKELEDTTVRRHEFEQLLSSVNRMSEELHAYITRERR